MANLYQFPPAAWAGRPGYKVCVAIAGTSPAAMIERAGRVLAEHPFLELRLDSLPEPALLPPLLAPLLQQHPAAQFIATCRRREAGGDFEGSVAGELAVLEAAAQVGCGIVDLALETTEEMRLDQHRSFHEALRASGAMLMVSYHNYHRTGDLDLTLQRLSRHQPDIVKLVTTANSLSDNLAILRMLGSRQGSPVVGIAMGEAGIPSRVLSVRSGALFTFAAADTGAETAPGQLTAATLRDLYRIDTINAATRVYGVAGQPIAHSLSPLLHNTGFRARGINSVFLPLATSSANDLLQLVRGLPLEGVSVTMPLKEAVLPFLDHIDPLAAKVGACNTIVRSKNGELHGYNTDVAGVTEPLTERLDLNGARILVRGAGGAARAAVFGLREAGAEVWIQNRTPARAAALATEAGAHLVSSGVTGSGLGNSNVAGVSFDAIVNATPLGMESCAALSPVRERPSGEVSGPLPGSLSWPPGDAAQAEDDPLPAKLIFDMVYRPLETPLIAQARAQGLPVITGEEMFVHQGARQFELWTGEAAPQDEMRRAVLDALEEARLSPSL
jgi:3-dehydroquinate dehydratase/shikimate dehydrogenase